jgi:hypothetical protein
MPGQVFEYNEPGGGAGCISQTLQYLNCGVVRPVVNDYTEEINSGSFDRLGGEEVLGWIGRKFTCMR